MAPNKVRQLVITRILDGKTQSDVAKAMGIPIGTVRSYWRQYKERGDTDDLPKVGPAKTTRMPELIESVKLAIDTDPNQSIRGLARRFKMAETIMRRIIKEDLALKSLTVVKVQQLMPAQRLGRREKGTIILNKLKGEAAGKIIAYSDEKEFHVNKHINSRNQRTIAKSPAAVSPANRFIGKSKFPSKAMLFAFVGSDGTAFPLVWINGTLNSAGYKQIIAHKVFPILDRTYGMGNYIFMQDGAAPHTANCVLSYLERWLGSKGFWSKGVWPANSPNLNPLDFSIWEYVASRACKNAHNSVDSLKAAVEAEWNTLPRDYVRKVCSSFRRRVEAMVKADGGVFERN